MVLEQDLKLMGKEVGEEHYRQENIKCKATSSGNVAGEEWEVAMHLVGVM